MFAVGNDNHFVGRGFAIFNDWHDEVKLDFAFMLNKFATDSSPMNFGAFDFVIERTLRAFFVPLHVCYDVVAFSFRFSRQFCNSISNNKMF